MPLFTRRVPAQSQQANQQQQPRFGPVPFVLATKPVEYVDGSINYVSGRLSNSLPLDKAKLLAGLLVHVKGVMTFDQPAGAPAPAFVDPEIGALNLVKALILSIAGSGVPLSASAYLLTRRMLAHYPAMSYEVTAPLPPANGGGAAVQTPENWEFYIPIDIAVDDRDLTGILLMQGRAANVDLRIQWGAETDVVSLPNGTTAQFQGYAEVVGVRYELPPTPQQLPPLSMIHVQEEFDTPVSTSGWTDVQLPVGDIYQRILLVPLAGGLVDASNQMQIEGLRLRYSGSYHQIDVPAGAAGFLSQLRSRNSLGPAVYQLDFFADRPRNYLDSSNLTELKLQVQFGAQPPAGSAVRVFTERLQRLVA